MKASHLEILVEELSMELFLRAVLPKILGNKATFTVHSYQGKDDLLSKLSIRLRAYSKWLPDYARIIVIVDKDENDCTALKSKMELIASKANLKTKTTCAGKPWQIGNRIAIEELEAWFFGEWAAVVQAFARVSATIPKQAAYRRPDSIAGGTWEALERILQRAGYFSNGMRKLEAAQKIGQYFDPATASSPSFIAFRDAVLDAVN